jgi:ribonuclease HII
MDRVSIGIDEAGRGPVLGPMVVAGVWVRAGGLEALSKLVYRDSKALSPSVREALAWRMRYLLEGVAVKIVPPSTIDEWVLGEGRGLNSLEFSIISSIISLLRVDEVYIDSWDVKPERLRERLEEVLPRGVKVICEHKADERHPIVGAASIIAKTIRDREISKLTSIYGSLGSGYSSDGRTISFLQEWYKRRGGFPSFARKSWKTLERIRRGGGGDFTPS